jgi:hypothetical protein
MNIFADGVREVIPREREYPGLSVKGLKPPLKYIAMRGLEGTGENVF